METGVSKKPRPTGETHAARVRRERAAAKAGSPERDLLTPDEMLDILRNEAIAISRAAAMQIGELTAIATDYARGRLSAEEANRRYMQHSDRWPDPMHGIYTFEGKSDEAILDDMVRARKRYAEMIDRTFASSPERGKDKGPSR
jgi:hypothetical protein